MLARLVLVLSVAIGCGQLVGCASMYGGRCGDACGCAAPCDYGVECGCAAPCGCGDECSCGVPSCNHSSMAGETWDCCDGEGPKHCYCTGLNGECCLEVAADGWPVGGMAIRAVAATAATSQLVAANRRVDASHVVRPVAAVRAAMGAAEHPKAPAPRYGTPSAAALAATANSTGASGTTTRRDAAIRATNAAIGSDLALAPTERRTVIPMRWVTSRRECMPGHRNLPCGGSNHPASDRNNRCAFRVVWAANCSSVSPRASAKQRAV